MVLNIHAGCLLFCVRRLVGQQLLCCISQCLGSGTVVLVSKRLVHNFQKKHHWGVFIDLRSGNTCHKIQYVMQWDNATVLLITVQVVQ